MINKNVLMSAFFIMLATLSHTYGAELGSIKETIEETITKQNVDFYFYDNYHKEIANLEYRLEDESTIYLSYIKIYDRNNRGNSLGKQLFTYFVNHVKERNPAIKTIRWQALALDEGYMSQEKLEAWYTARGGVRTGRCSAGGSYFKLRISKFEPEQDLSSVLALKIKENVSIKGTTEIELKTTRDHQIAKLGFLLSIHEGKYSLKIDNLAINPTYSSNKTEIQRKLRRMIIKHIRAKEWLEDCTAKIKTNGILPRFSI